jgi:hypothetical protein
MSSLRLLDEVAHLLLIADISEPSEMAAIYSKIDEKVEIICKISKKDKTSVTRLCNKFAEDLAKKEFAEGRLISMPRMIKLPMPPEYGS